MIHWSNELKETKNAVEQLEQEYSSLLNRSYSFGENATPFKFNNKTVYVYRLNKNQDLNLGGSGLTELVNGVYEMIEASVFCFNAGNDDDSRNKWSLLPYVKRGDHNSQIQLVLTSDGKIGLHNKTIIGNRKFQGYIYYTKSSDLLE